MRLSSQPCASYLLQTRQVFQETTNIHGLVTLVELKPQKWTQKVTIVTYIMASARSCECMLSLINNQWADAYLKNILCIVHFMTQAAISCNWEGKIYVKPLILRPLSMSRESKACSGRVKAAGMYILWVEDLQNRNVTTLIRYTDLVWVLEQW